MLIFDYQFIRAMQKSEGKPNAFETPQNADQTNALKQEELKQGRDNNIAGNSFLHEQYKQLKETFEFGFFPFADQQQNTETSTVLKLQNEQQILEGCRKVDGMNQNQRNRLSPAYENPLTTMLLALNCRGLITNDFIESIGRFVWKKFPNLIQSICRQKKTIKQQFETNRSVQTFSQASKSTCDPQNQSMSKLSELTDCQQNQLINNQKLESNYTSQKSEYKKTQKIIIDQFNHQSSMITYYAHAKFLSFLNKSMERLNVKHQIIKYCLDNSTWPLGYKAIDFFRRLMAIKTFFPQLFPQIVNHFKIIIQQFLLKTRLKQDQMYARQILTKKYLKCVNIYSETDDILEAAKCIYYVPKNKVIIQKINSLSHDQTAMKLQASLQKRKEQGDQSVNLMRHPPKSWRRHSIREEAMKRKNSIQIQVFKTNHKQWNPVSQPSNFQLQIDVDHTQMVQDIHSERDFGKSD